MTIDFVMISSIVKVVCSLGAIAASAPPKNRTALLLFAMAELAMPLTSLHGQGIALPAAGAINQSMGGAATGCVLSAAGALYWNPATIGQLEQSEAEFGLGIALPQSSLSSRLPANSLGPGSPPFDLSGDSASDSGAMPVPMMAFVRRSNETPFDFGIGIFPIGGFGVNYAASYTNPILTPQPPIGAGLGRVFSDSQTLQFAPTVSCQVTEQLAVGVAPTATMARVLADPLFLAPPVDAAGDASFYMPGTGTRFHWGAGFQIGAFYAASPSWTLGASLKSPQWFEPLVYNSQDQLGRPLIAEVDFDYPLIASFGIGYGGLADTTVAWDVRYIDYSHTDGFKDSGFRSDGAVAGLGWESIFAMAVGIQRRLSERVTARVGYSYNDNPIPHEQSQFNVASPLIIEHLASIGMTILLGESWDATLAYTHGFENSITGPFETPFGQILGSSVTSRVSSDLLTAGLRVRF